jgi:hypothetical protein
MRVFPLIGLLMLCISATTRHNVFGYLKHDRDPRSQ